MDLAAITAKKIRAIMIRRFLLPVLVIELSEEAMLYPQIYQM